MPINYPEDDEMQGHIETVFNEEGVAATLQRVALLCELMAENNKEYRNYWQRWQDEIEDLLATMEG